jgi:hypothetical protein
MARFDIWLMASLQFIGASRQIMDIRKMGMGCGHLEGSIAHFCIVELYLNTPNLNSLAYHTVIPKSQPTSCNKPITPALYQVSSKPQE